MANESAIIMPIGEVEPMIARLRQEYDRSAALGVPAHITLLYPFRAPQLAERQLENLAEFFRDIPGFTFSFTEVRRFSRTVYLYPDQPERFIGIINKLERWSDRRIYGGAFPETIPHLTVADQVDSQTMDMVQASLADQLPVRCVAQEAWLLYSNDVGFWSKRECFPLGADIRGTNAPPGS